MVQWKPKLYLSKTNDNFYPQDEFYTAFKINSSYSLYSFSDIVCASIAFTKHCLMALILLLSAPTLPYPTPSFINSLTLYLLLLITVASFTCRLIATVFSNQLFKILKQSFNFVFFLYSFSHLVHSLLFAISSDTIIILVFLFICLNIIFNNFASRQHMSDSSQRISFNFGISASLCVASRHYDPLHSFLLILFAIEIYNIHPHERDMIINHLINISSIVLILSLFLMTNPADILHLILISFVIWVNFIFPLWFFQFRRFKVNLYGPWNEFQF